MLEGFQSTVFNGLQVTSFLVNLLVALICGFIISLFYRGSYRGPHYSTSFVQALVVLSMVTALVIMVIGNNLARAFGLVGAMSIIRFRTAVKDTQDIVFIFFSLAAGMAAGVGLKGLAMLGTVLIGSVLILMSRLNYAQPHKRDFLLQFQCDVKDGEGIYLPVLEKYCRQNKLVNMQSIGTDNQFELSFYIELKKRDKRTDLIRDLNQIPQIDHVRLYMDDDQL
jgi:uncharacterized membrane protein YhiD involved in acid resistance